MLRIITINEEGGFNMGEWSKRVPTDMTVYEKHESVPHNPKIADVFLFF